MYMDAHGCVPVKFYFQNQVEGQMQYSRTSLKKKIVSPLKEMGWFPGVCMNIYSGPQPWLHIRVTQRKLWKVLVLSLHPRAIKSESLRWGLRSLLWRLPKWFQSEAKVENHCMKSWSSAKLTSFLFPLPPLPAPLLLPLVDEVAR